MPPFSGIVAYEWPTLSLLTLAVRLAILLSVPHVVRSHRGGLEMATTTIPQVVLPDVYNAASTFLDRNIEEGRGERIAIYCEDERWTYRQVQALANRIGNALHGMGIEMEQRVALLLLDSPQLASAFWGAIKLGAVPIPINTSLRPADYVYILNDSRAKVLLISAELWPTVQSLLPELDFLRHVVVVRLSQAGQQESSTLHDFAR